MKKNHLWWEVAALVIVIGGIIYSAMHQPKAAPSFPELPPSPPMRVTPKPAPTPPSPPPEMTPAEKECAEFGCGS